MVCLTFQLQRMCFPRRQKLSQKRFNVGLLYTSPDMSDEQKAAVGARLHAFGKTVEEELHSDLTETPSGLNDDHSSIRLLISRLVLRPALQRLAGLTRLLLRWTLVVRRAMGHRCGRPSGPSNGTIKAFGQLLHLLSGMRTV